MRLQCGERGSRGEEPNRAAPEHEMKIGVAADHGGFEMKRQLAKLLATEGHEVVDFRNAVYDADDDYPDFTIPLARAVAIGDVKRGVLVCGSVVGGSVAPNNVNGVRAPLCEDHFSARQGVEDEDMNILCFGGRTIVIAPACACPEHFLHPN